MTGSAHEVPYSEVFENSLMEVVLNPPSHDLAAPPTQDTSSPSSIPPSALPLPLLSSLRTYPSPIPGVLLTHHGGSIYGGPGPSTSSPAHQAFAQDFIARHNIRDKDALERVVQAEKQKALAKLREQMEARQEAVRKNEEVKGQIERLVKMREMEVRVEEKMRGSRRGRRGGSGEEGS